MAKKKSSGGQYIVYTQDELAQARETDMIEFLQRHNGYSFVREGSDYRCKEHNSLCIRSDRKRWYWNSHQVGGNNVLDWLQTIERFDFKTACGIVISKGSYDSRNFNPAPKTVPRNEQQAVFKLPPATEEQYKRVYSYLAYVRNISHEVIMYCFKNKTLYQDDKFNCVFVGRDENGIAKYAERKSTSLYPYAIGKVEESLSDNVSRIYMKALMRVGRSEYDCTNAPNDTEFVDSKTQGIFRNSLKGHKFRGNISGCDFDYNFHIDAEIKSDKVYIFEAPIDVMAHCTLTNMKAQQAGVQNWESAFLHHNRLSLSGTTDRSLQPYLDRRPEINQIIVCTDNDAAGNKVAENIKAKYSAIGYEVKYIPSKRGKDYAEYLDIITEAQKNNAPEEKTYTFRR